MPRRCRLATASYKHGILIKTVSCQQQHRVKKNLCRDEVVPKRGRANKMSLQNGVVTTRCRLNTTSCHDDVVTKRCHVNTTPGQHYFGPSRRRDTNKSPPQHDVVQKSYWHGVVFTRYRFCNGVVLTRHPVDTASYWRDTVLTRCHLGAISC